MLSLFFAILTIQLEWEKHLICGSHNSRYQFVESVTNIKLLYVQDFQVLLKSIQLLYSANENSDHNRSFLLFLMNVLFPAAVIVKVPVYWFRRANRTYLMRAKANHLRLLLISIGFFYQTGYLVGPWVFFLTFGLSLACLTF